MNASGGDSRDPPSSNPRDPEDPGPPTGRVGLPTEPPDLRAEPVLRAEPLDRAASDCSCCSRSLTCTESLNLRTTTRLLRTRRGRHPDPDRPRPTRAVRHQPTT